jgi:alginate O-acetyltransferase complex protein AlgI
MWLLAATIFFACKFLTWAVADHRAVSPWRQLAYLLAWTGMDAARFFATGDASRPCPPTKREWLRATLNLAAGCLVFWTAQHWIAETSPIVLGWAGMIGVILILHFGSFHLLSCFWRRLGIDAPPLKNRPTRSTSVAEFWGRRWNMAFRDLTYQFLFRPLRTRLGAIGALVVGFIISGIIHDLVISVPAGGGYGGPTAFFMIQPAAILIERSSAGRSVGLGRGWCGWLFTALILLLPARLLFHDPFVTRIVLPFMHALGAA